MTDATPRRRRDSGVGARLRELREERGLSQSEVARRIGRAPSWVCHIERGAHDPIISSLLLYCSGIGARIHIGLIDPTTKGDPGGERAW